MLWMEIGFVVAAAESLHWRHEGGHVLDFIYHTFVSGLFEKSNILLSK